MASIVLSSVGGTLGGAAGGVAGAAIGSAIGRTLGGWIDQQVFGGDGKERIQTRGPRLSDLTVQTSTYGKMIPILYGTARMAGNIIWSLPIKEVMTTSSSTTGGGGGGKGGGGGGSSGTTVTTVTYSYYATLAIAICEGVVDEVIRVWADAKLLNLGQGSYRVYRGTEEQLPDSMIEAYQGVGKTPAYRGMAYVVMEDFPLADFGNRIPNFTFEVRRRLKPEDVDGQAVEELITGVVMIPGSGEFVYDTAIQHKVEGVAAGDGFAPTGQRVVLNAHTHEGKANALVSLDQLGKALPNLEWVAVVVTWFGNSMDAGSCVIKPGVEFTTEAITQPEAWDAGGYDRLSAHVITRDETNSPVYGGTPDDASVLRYLTELKNRGYNILFLPMFFMDVTDKPWRGRVTGSPSEVADFFTRFEGYNAFITHYAGLVSGVVDAFAIGSELKGLTAVMDGPGEFPAVDALVSLAATVKGMVGAGVKVTYAADWSEYHHTEGGWYHLDPLWASDDIDMVGIDAYFPLTDGPQQGYDIQAIRDGWVSGEGYDFYYSDEERTVQAPLSAAYAWKNLAWWWGNAHINPDSMATGWTPGSKPVWFVEYGFPSVDGATNQPNVFYDPTSSESALPRHSRGRVDWRIQRAAIAATEKEWEGSAMVEQKFIWTWDARPFPYWPDLKRVWADGASWKYGHWISGKLGISGLAAIVRDLCQRAGMEEGQLDVSRLNQLVEGMVLTQPIKAREAIGLLQQAFFFDAAESDGLLKFVPRGEVSSLTIAGNMLVPEAKQPEAEPLQIIRQQEIELPREAQVVHFNPAATYQPGTQLSRRETVAHKQVMALNLPLVLSEQQAKIVADVALYNAWVERAQYRFRLPVAYAALEPTDVVTVTAHGVSHLLRLTRVWYGSPGMLEVEAVAEDVSAYDFYSPPGSGEEQTENVVAVVETRAELLDLPCLPGNPIDASFMHIASTGRDAPWRGCVLYRSDDGGVNYGTILTDEGASAVGVATTVLEPGPLQVIDEGKSIEVAIEGTAELSSAASELALLNGANACVIGDEIVQFRHALLLSPGIYKLSGLLRGRLGTEWAIASHVAGERFVLLDGSVNALSMHEGLVGLPRQYKAVTLGSTLGATAEQAFTYQARSLKPLAPAHVTGWRTGSDLEVSWIRRTRGGGEWRDLVDVPLNESSERYEVEILDGSDVVRVFSGLTTPAVTYTALEQTADFGSPQWPVSLRVYQLSERVGRGYASEASL